MTGFWDVLCSLVESERRFRGSALIITRRPDDGGCKDLRNFGQFLLDYTEDKQTDRTQTRSSRKN